MCRVSDVRLGFCKVTPIAFFYKNIIFLLTNALKYEALLEISYFNFKEL
jgi:hypothetical protein